MLGDIYATYFAQSGYTTVQTVVYALLLVVAIYLIYRLFLKRIKTEIDTRFVVSMVPFILLGGILRSLGHGDAEIFTGFWFNTPGIHVLIALYTIPSIVLSEYLEERYGKTYVKWMWLFGGIPFLICTYIAAGIGFPNYEAFGWILGTTALVAAPLYAVTHFFPSYLTRLNYFILSGHILDGVSTFVAVSMFGYAEKHVLPGFLIGSVGPWIMIPLKISVIWPVLYLLDDVVEDKQLLNWLRVVVLALGLALGVRNMFTVAMGV